MNRRSFLSSAGLILGAPAIVRAESLMKIWVPTHTEHWLADKAKVRFVGDPSLDRILIPRRWVTLEEFREMFPTPAESQIPDN